MGFTVLVINAGNPPLTMRLYMKLAPCTLAAHDENAQVSDECCTVVKNIDVSCLCAIMLSDIAKSSGINPAVAVTIPKRCNLANRPVGYKCGGVLTH